MVVMSYTRPKAQRVHQSRSSAGTKPPIVEPIKIAIQVRVVKSALPFAGGLSVPRSSRIGRAPALSLGQMLHATLAGKVITPQVSSKKAEWETNENRDRKIKHSGSGTTHLTQAQAICFGLILR
jgi:hypothetical protein